MSPDERPPVLALLDPPHMEDPDVLPWDDFALRPWGAPEIAARLRRLLRDRDIEDIQKMIAACAQAGIPAW